MFRIKDKDGTTRLEGGALTLTSAINIFHPINSIIMTTDNVNPGTRFPGTTWVAWGAGRAVVGVGSNGTNTYTSEQTFGADSITLTAAQSGVNAHNHINDISNPYHNHATPNHQHGVDYETLIGANPTGTGYDIVVNIQGGSNTSGTNDKNGLTEFASAGDTYGASNSSIVGGVGAIINPTSATSHDNRQTSIATYLWKRTV